MRCPICQTEAPDSSLFCTVCGASLRSAASPADDAASTLAAQPFDAAADRQVLAFGEERADGGTVGGLSALIGRVRASTRGDPAAPRA